MSETQATLSYRIADAAAANRTLAQVLTHAEACGGEACPLCLPVAIGLVPALAAGNLEVLWDETISLAQTGVACQDQCPGVDGLLAVMHGITVSLDLGRAAA